LLAIWRRVCIPSSAVTLSGGCCASLFDCLSLNASSTTVSTYIYPVDSIASIMQ
jgi:hypothetical protein